MSRFALSLFLWVAFCGTYAQALTSVVLISVDTLRADHLGCYERSRQRTPNIDALAKTGTLFSQVSSLVPLTLPSHIALFTSTYPFVNGVRDNGVPLGSGVITLATVLKGDGYRTAGFVGGFVLDRRFGLDRGFDAYDSPFDLHKKIAMDAGDLKRPGAQVIAAAMRSLEHNSTPPFFLFVHLYDLHTPYDLPKDPRLRRGETGYEAELAEGDRVVGDFFRFLDTHKLLKKTLVALTSDHGEGLGDHGESTHSYFIYQSTLRVPLIIHWPSGEGCIQQDHRDEPASVIDIAPTILDAIGLPRPKQMQGRSLVESRGTEEVYSESLYARNHFGCGALHAIRVGRYKYIDAPHPELYDLSSDPGELQNVYEQEKLKATALRERLVAMRSRSQANRSVARIPPLRKPSTPPLAWISEWIHGQIAGSNRLLEQLSKKLPDVLEIRVSLGLNRQRLNEFAQPANEFRFVVDRDPLNARAHFDLALSYFRLHQSERAIESSRVRWPLSRGIREQRNCWPLSTFRGANTRRRT